MLALNTLWNMDKFYWKLDDHLVPGVWNKRRSSTTAGRQSFVGRDKIPGRAMCVNRQTTTTTTWRRKRSREEATIRKTNFTTSNPLSAEVNCGFPISLAVCAPTTTDERKYNRRVSPKAGKLTRTEFISLQKKSKNRIISQLSTSRKKSSQQSQKCAA